MKKSKSNLNTILSCSPDKNIIYYLTDEEYKLYKFSYDNWDKYFLGKFSVEKCLKLLKSAYKKYKIDLFQNIKSKVIKVKKSKLRGKSVDLVIYDDFGIYGKEEK